MNAYDKIYLEDAMNNMADMFDYVSNDCHMDKDGFFALFISTGVADAFGRGTPRIVSGMSGAELAQEVFLKSGYPMQAPEPVARISRSPDYWCGWILAFYQWSTGLTFEQISKQITLAEIETLYPTLHEAPEEKFLDVMLKRVQNRKEPTYLQTIRKTARLTQQELSQKAGVSLRSIQLYEQREKDINKAQARTVDKLARTLGCRVEDLLEPEMLSELGTFHSNNGDH